MDFQLTKNPTEPQGQRLLPQPKGETICYEEPIEVDLLPKLMRALEETEWPYKFHGLFYRLRTKSGYIEEHVPASEYYKISWRAMSQKYHGARLALQSLEANATEVSQTYRTRRTATGGQDQPKLVFSLELYKLRSDFATLLFLIRSTLDQFASLIQFLSGPKSLQVGSFADVLKKCASESPPSQVPVTLQEYLRTQCTWFLVRQKKVWASFGSGSFPST